MALLQDARRDIDQREQDAPRYYHLAPDAGDQAVSDATRSKAEMLDRWVSCSAKFDATHISIDRATPLRQPLVAGWDAVRQPGAGKITVLRTSISTSVPQNALDLASLLYGLAGLLLGGCSVMHSARRLRRQRGGSWQNTIGRKPGPV